MVKIFVYGTLMQGFGNNRLLRTSQFLGEALTQSKYNIKGRGIPFLMEGSHKVLGEVYEVDQDVLESLDRLEGHPDFYSRKPIKVIGFEEVQAYFMQDEDMEDSITTLPKQNIKSFRVADRERSYD